MKMLLLLFEIDSVIHLKDSFLIDIRKRVIFYKIDTFIQVNL